MRLDRAKSWGNSFWKAARECEGHLRQARLRQVSSRTPVAITNGSGSPPVGLFVETKELFVRVGNDFLIKAWNCGEIELTRAMNS